MRRQPDLKMFNSKIQLLLMGSLVWILPCSFAGKTKDQSKKAVSPETVQQRIGHLFAAGKLAHEMADFDAEQAAYEAILVWDSLNKKAQKLLAVTRESKARWKREQLEKKLRTEVAKAIEEAQHLAGAGKLNEALTSLGRTVKLYPDNERVQEFYKRLQRAIADREAKLTTAEVVESEEQLNLIRKLKEEAKRLRKEGEFAEANRIERKVAALTGSEPIIVRSRKQATDPDRLIRRPSSAPATILLRKTRSTGDDLPEGITRERWIKAKLLLEQYAEEVKTRKHRKKLKEAEDLLSPPAPQDQNP